MLFNFLLVVQALVAAGLIGVILMQKSEGGGLGVGGSPAGFLSARGAADFLTRATAILASIFVGLSIALAVLASVNHGAARVNANATAAQAPTVPAVAGEPAAPVPGSGVPIVGGAADPLAAAGAATAAQPQPAEEKGVPLQQ
jgi:preprotein translocase subunit SecG